jgi:hypothetical protein
MKRTHTPSMGVIEAESKAPQQPSSRREADRVIVALAEAFPNRTQEEHVRAAEAILRDISPTGLPRSTPPSSPDRSGDRAIAFRSSRT